jgi:hypothetical protein
MSNVTLQDNDSLIPALQSTNPTYLTYYYNDLLHPNNAGNYLIAQLTNATLNQIYAGSLSSPVNFAFSPKNQSLTDQVLVAAAPRLFYTGPFTTGNWSTSTVTGGTATLGGHAGNVATTTSASAGFVYYQCQNAVLAGTGGSANEADFSRSFWMFATLTGLGNGGNAEPNTNALFTFGKNGVGLTTGDLTVRGVGLKFALDTANVAHVYGECHNATTLTVSSSSKYTFATTGNYSHKLAIFSDGKGNVSFYIDNNLLDKLTGGPTDFSGGIYSQDFVFELDNAGDSTGASAAIANVSIYQVN